MARVLGRVRLSRFTKESTSVERQQEIILNWAQANDHVVTAWAIDVDLSRSVDPWDAPELGPYLGRVEKMDEYDILAVWKLDRLGAGSIILHKVMSHCQKHDKTLVSVSENLDLSTWVGRMVAAVIAGLAEGELEAIKERTQGSQAKIRSLGRWHGGRHPFGYTPVKENDGWYLKIDPDSAEIVREIFRRVLNLETRRSVADMLNDRGVSSPNGRRWSGPTLTHIVRSRGALGQAEHRGRAVLGKDGLPLQRAEPIVAFDVWQAAQSVIADSSKPKTRSHETNLLLDVAFCSVCGEKLWQYADQTIKSGRTYTYRYLRCSGRNRLRNGCTAPSIIADHLEQLATEALMEKIGDIEVTDPVFVPGSDNSESLQRVNEAIDTARREADLGLYEGDQDSYLARMAALVTRRQALESEDNPEPRWDRRGTGVTYRQRWEQTTDVSEHRRLLLDSGIKVKARARPFEFAVDVPLDVLQRSVPGFDPDAPTAT